jgi:hypothetical protein
MTQMNMGKNTELQPLVNKRSERKGIRDLSGHSFSFAPKDELFDADCVSLVRKEDDTMQNDFSADIKLKVKVTPSSTPNGM